MKSPINHDLTAIGRAALSPFNHLYANYLRHGDLDQFLAELIPLNLSVNEIKVREAIAYRSKLDDEHPTRVFKAAKEGHWYSRWAFGNKLLYLIAIKGSPTLSTITDYEKEYLRHVVKWIEEAKIISDSATHPDTPFSEEEILACRQFAGNLSKTLSYNYEKDFIDDSDIPPELVVFCSKYADEMTEIKPIYIHDTEIYPSLSEAIQIREVFFSLHAWTIGATDNREGVGNRTENIFIKQEGLTLSAFIAEEELNEGHEYFIYVNLIVKNTFSCIAKDIISITESGINYGDNLLLNIAHSAAEYCHFLNSDKLQRLKKSELATFCTSRKKINTFIQAKKNKEKPGNKKKKSKK